MMRTGWLTGILLGVGVIVLVAVPPVRQAAVEAYRTYNLPGTRALPTRREYEKIAKAHLQDAAIWLGFAQIIDAPVAEIAKAWSPDWDEGSTWTATQAYERAISIPPQSPAPYLRHALSLLAATGRLARKEEWGADRAAEPLLTRPEVRNLRQAESLLKQARRLDRENAACDYLLASIYLAEHRDEEALAALQAATEKPHWDIASQEAATALLQLMDETDMPALFVPTNAQARCGLTEFPVFSRLRTLASILVGIAEKRRAQGRHREAIAYYEATMHLGHIMRADAYSLIEGLVAVAVTSIVSGPFLSEEQRQHIEKDTPITEDEAKLSPEAKMAVMMGDTKHRASVPEEQWDPAERWWHQTQERSQRMQEARVANFVAYLTQHGRADLAAFYNREMEADSEWRDRVKPIPMQSMSEMTLAFYGGAARFARAAWIETSAMLILWMIVGLISVVARYCREANIGLRWAYWEWGVLLGLGLCFIAGQLLPQPDPESPLALIRTESWAERPISVGIGIVAWLAVVLALTLLKRARQAPEQYLGKARSYLVSLRTLLPPTFAVLLLLSVIALWPAHRSRQEWADEQRTIIEQGEVKYWGIGEADGQDIGWLLPGGGG